MEGYIRTRDAESVIQLVLSCDDPFLLFGIPHGIVDAGEVITLYRKISLLIHPDRCQFQGAEEAFKKIGTAKVGNCARNHFIHEYIS